jgi:hypothetical protein
MPDPTPADTGLLPRTYFKAPRVPLDLRALFLALVGYGIYRIGVWLLNLAFAPVNPVGSFFQEVLETLNLPYIGGRGGELSQFLGIFVSDDGGGTRTDGNFWQTLVGGAWALGVWGFFGQAIHRITSLRIARDEGMSIAKAVGFSIRNFVTIALCPLIVAVAIGIFYGCNAAAGALVSVPFLGGILAIVLVPLAMIATLLILLIAIGGAVGLPLVGAAAAWERNGSLDAISRAFSYVFARPLQFFWNYFLIFLMTAILITAGGHFEKILRKSVDSLAWSETTSVLIDGPTAGNGDPEYAKLSSDGKALVDKLQEKTGGARPFARDFQAVVHAPWSNKLQALVFWLVLAVIRFGVYAVAIWWFFGATTSVYADLRADVDGTEEDEIYLEEEDEDFEKLAAAPAPAPAALTSPASASPTPTLPPPPPPPAT